jgi:hypothetical protein
MLYLIIIYLPFLSAPHVEPQINLWDSEGALEITIKGKCDFTKTSPFSLFEKGTKKSLSNVKVLLRQGKKNTILVTDKDGGVKLPGYGKWELIFQGDELHYPCRVLRVRDKTGPSTIFNSNILIWMFLLLGIGFILWVFRFKVLSLVKKKRVEKKEDLLNSDSFIQKSSGRFGINTIFGSKKWIVTVVDWKGTSRLKDVKIKYKIANRTQVGTTDKHGKFISPAGGFDSLFSLSGYRSQLVQMGRSGGEMTVKMVRLREWSLFLLKEIFHRYDPALASRLTPREGLLLKIPPPDVISRLEILAYGDENPTEKELNTLREFVDSKSKI